MKTYEFAYGRGTKTFTLDENRVLKEVETATFEPMKDVKAGILEAINNPIGRPALSEIVKPGQKVAFICNDLTRVANSFDFMPVFLDEMNRLGVKDEDMHIVFSLGTHREMTRDEMAIAVGKEVVDRVKCYNSISTNQEDFEYFGETSRGTPLWFHKQLCNVDHVIMTGSIVYHYFSGYGGGRKAILPGCAAMETVRVNHSFMLSPEAGLGKTTGNPCYEDQMEGVAKFAEGRSLFLFNGVLNAQHQFLKMFAGDYIAAHKEACKFVDQVYGCVIPQEADIVIASCGGYPKDINVYQMQKTMDNAALAVRQGGAVILLADCEEGSGSKVLEETCRRLGSPDAIEKELESNFKIGANKAFAVTRLMKKADYHLVTSLDPTMAKEMLFAGTYTNVEDALKAVEAKLGADAKIILMPEGSLTVPRVE